MGFCNFLVFPEHFVTVKVVSVSHYVCPVVHPMSLISLSQSAVVPCFTPSHRQPVCCNSLLHSVTSSASHLLR